MSTNQQIRQEMSAIQAELHTALQELRQTAGKQLKSAELAQIQDEFRQLDELLERLKTGLVWITLFGKTSVGKSAVANALIGEDLAVVGPEHDLTVAAHTYRKPPWMLVDVPGIMGETVNEELAIAEAKKAHGHIFVIDGEPYETELRLFDLVHEALPTTPKIVFVNKYDRLEHTTTRDRATICGRIEAKMGKYVRSPADIVYGSAQRYDPTSDEMVRQELPQLLSRLYEDAGTLGQVMNVLDPAGRADEIAGSVRAKIVAMRVQVARRVIRGFATASIASIMVPFSTLLITPGILASMVYTLFLIMGRRENKTTTSRVTVDLLKFCAQEMGAGFAAGVAAEVLLDSAAVLGPVGFLLGALGNVVGLSVFKYQRTVLLGELTLEYIRNDCSWGGEDQHAIIQRCKLAAQQHYSRLARKAA